MQPNTPRETQHPNPIKHPIVWTIAGSDSGGGAGIQADQRAIESFGAHACTAIAAITSQNSISVEHVEAVSPTVLESQLSALAQDMPPAAIKTGMLATAENVHVVTKWLDRLRNNSEQTYPALVVDPILRASTGLQFANEAFRQAILSTLLPRATLIKPNLKEAFWLITGQDKPTTEIDRQKMPELAQALRKMGAQNVVITGGDLASETNTSFAIDWLDSAQVSGWISLPLTPKTTTHGTGCTFTSSAAAALALGFCPADAAILAKMSVTQALQNGYTPGHGLGMVYAQKGFATHSQSFPAMSLTPFNIRATPDFAPLSDENMGLYAIVDSSEWVKCVIDAGVKTVQLRIKAQDKRIQGTSGYQFLSQEVKRSSDYAKAAHVQFFVNDHWQLALEHQAYGVHLGQEDFPNADLSTLRQAGIRLGVSIYSLWDVSLAKSIAPSYYACGPIYETSSKNVPYLTQGLDNLAYFKRILDKPLVAIGGIDLPKVADVVRAGANGISVISAIMGQKNPEQAIQQLHQEIQKAHTLSCIPFPELPHSVLKA